MVAIIAMLTHDDRTVANATEIFRNSIAAPTAYWGFKDTAISPADAADLAKLIRDSGKQIVFESFGEEESDCLRAAEFAADQGCSHLIGCAFHSSVAKLLSDSEVSYLPTFGQRSGVPRMLYGCCEDIVSDGMRVLASGADGLCLSMYRYKDGDPEALAAALLETVNSRPTIITGSINTFTRLKKVRDLKPWGFTIGSALFEEAFGKDLTWPEQISVLQAILNA